MTFCWSRGREDAIPLDVALRKGLNFSRDKFHVPAGSIYFCGNSLGLQPVRVRELIDTHLLKWATKAADGHFEGAMPWVNIEDEPAKRSLDLIGAKYVHEVAYMNSLTVNIHLLLTAIYRPTDVKCKILLDRSAFPSDEYALKTHVEARGLDPDEVLIYVSEREGESTLRDEDILKAIRENAQQLELVFLPGVVYSTGQVLDMKSIAETARECGVKVGFDLAHAVANVPLELNEWGVDFAVWCTYKYLNGGPGAVAGAFLHDIHSGDNVKLPRLGGWWGIPMEERFKKIDENMTPQKGVRGLQISNVPVLSMVPVIAALDVLKESGGTNKVREHSIRLTEFLQKGIEHMCGDMVEVVTPSEKARRGCQLSVRIRGRSGEEKGGMREINSALKERGVICDVREPDLLRVAAAPLYNTYGEAVRFVEILAAVVGAGGAN